MYGWAHGNSLEASRLYQGQFPNRRAPHPRTFKGLREHGHIQPPSNRERTEEVPENIDIKLTSSGFKKVTQLARRVRRHQQQCSLIVNKN